METTELLYSFLKVAFVIAVFLQVLPIMVWVERRGSALLQNRLGPNRVGPLGLLHSLADVVKFIFKEDRVPSHVHKFYYVLAPFVSVVPAFLTFAVVPFAAPIQLADRTLRFQIAQLDVGLLYVFAIASLGVYGIIMAGWSSNNKYALLGSVRSTAQMISYELSLTLSLVGIIMLFSSVNIGDIIEGQKQIWFSIGSLNVHKWGVLVQPVGFLIFLTAIFAETNRLPFDLPEGESEIVAGFHLEYGAMKFALFMMAEYLHMTVASALVVCFFFGGYQLLPGFSLLIDLAGLEGLQREWFRAALEAGSFAFKTGFFLWLFVWVRWTLPRFRYDQLMDFGWKVMLPLSLVNIAITIGLIAYGVL